jgi:adhesin transport system outer membrane protein
MERARAQNRLGSRGDAYLAAVSAYLNLASTKILANMTSDYEGQILELFNYVDKRAKAGAANPSDVDRVKARVINIHSSKVEQDSAHSAAGVEFIRLVNVVPQSMRLPLPEELGVQALPDAFDQASELALLNNPDIEALREELAAADLDIGSAKGRYLPRLNLEASKNEVAHASGSSGVQKDDRVMLVMNWTPFNSGGDLKFHEEKIARRNELIYRLDDQRRRVLQNLSAQYATLDSIRVRLKQGYQELESVASAVRSMSARMLSANQSLLDLLDVYERHYQAKTRLVNLHIQELSSVAQMTRLLESDASLGALSGRNKVDRSKQLGQ